MPAHGSKIAWQILQDITAKWTGCGDDLATATPLLGGYINTTLKLTTTDGNHAVLKITPHRVDDSFAIEAFQLDRLRSLGFPTPRVVLQRTGTPREPVSYLLMEFIEGVDLEQAREQCDPDSFNALQAELGEMIATLHQTTADRYGYLRADTLPVFVDWSAFYREIFEPVWRAADGCGLLSAEERVIAAKVRNGLDRLVAHADQPRLVHWDLWSSNVLAAPDPKTGRWKISALLDPGCRFAHAEAELAYIELFKTGKRAFFDAYRRTHPERDGYQAFRKHVYQLYFLLNHLRLFGSDYHRPTAETLHRLAPMV